MLHFPPPHLNFGPSELFLSTCDPDQAALLGQSLSRPGALELYIQGTCRTTTTTCGSFGRHGSCRLNQSLAVAVSVLTRCRFNACGLWFLLRGFPDNGSSFPPPNCQLLVKSGISRCCFRARSTSNGSARPREWEASLRARHLSRTCLKFRCAGITSGAPNHTQEADS